MKYLIVFFLIIIAVGLLANRELARDKERVRRMRREFSFRRSLPEGDERADGERDREKEEGKE
jgi:hypothetical protein